MRPAFSILIVDHDTLITTIIILINIINIIILITREKDDVLEVESEGRDADDELAARLEAGEVVSLGGKVIVTMIIIIINIIIIIISLGRKVIIIMRALVITKLKPVLYSTLWMAMSDENLSPKETPTIIIITI